METISPNTIGAADTSTQPLVSILIPVHNRCDLTRICLESLKSHADPSVPAEIIVIDDCSTDETADYLDSLGHAVRVLRNEERRCFGHNMNRAARQARGKYLCLLNNDTYVTAGWLQSLVNLMERDPSVGVLGNKHLFPSTGKLNHAGMAFDANGYPWHLYPGLDPDLPCANVNRELQIVTAACWLVPRRFFLSLGGFDERFRNGFEDIDFCLRVRQRHRKVYYCAQSVIYHHGQSSPGRTDNDQANWNHFKTKWANAIVPDLDHYQFQDGMLEAALPAEPLPRLTRGQSADVHFAVPLEVMTSFSWLTAQLALALDDLGVTVSIKPGPIHSSVGESVLPRLQVMMDRPASKFAHIKWNHYWEPFIAQELAGEINAEFFVTNYRYGRRQLHELDGWMRQVVMSSARKLPDSQYCLDALTELGIAPERCALVPHGFSPEVLTADGQDDRFRRFGTVFLAITNSNDVYRIGTDILLRAYDRAFTAADEVVLVLKDYSMSAETSLIARWLKERRGGPRIVHLMEFLDKEALIRLYRGADFFVAPFRGEGFSAKLLDAAAVGIPILAPGYGGPVDFLRPGTYYPLKYRTVPVGDCLDRNYSIVPDFAEWIEVDIEDLARQFRTIRQERAEADRRAQQARDFALKHFSWKNAALALQDALQRFGRERHDVIEARRLTGPTPKRLSVVIPTHNRREELAQCLDAYEQQTLDSAQWEIVLADDRSNYSVTDAVKQRVGRLPLRVLVNDTNCGPGLTRNRAIPETQGELVLFTGDDIIPDKYFLEEHLRAHKAGNAEQLAVLGHTYWHARLEVTPLMAYVTGAGGQQFFFDSLTPGKYVPHNYFYTSNVSLKRSFLIELEEWFNPYFKAPAYEDVELALRLERAGMRTIYHPKARGAHLHAMTDRSLLERQYKIGRSTLIYLQLHPELRPMEHLVFVQWLEIAQHILLRDDEFRRTAGELARFSGALSAWLDSLFTITEQLSAALNPDRFEHHVAGPLLQEQGTHRLWLTKRLYAYRLELALRNGMADEWMGVKAGEPNPARDLLHVLLCTGIWDLFRQETPRSLVPGPMVTPAGQMLKFARQLKRHPLLSPLWNRIKQIPGIRSLEGATRRVLHSLP